MTDLTILYTLCTFYPKIYKILDKIYYKTRNYLRLCNMTRKECVEHDFICPFKDCESKFNRPFKLKNHIFVHQNEKPYKCPEEKCNRAYPSNSHLIRHINQSHKEDKEVHIFSCPQCMKTYANRQNLLRHIKTNHVLKSFFSCEICKVEFRKKHQLSAHMYIHTGVKAFRCEECAEDFVSLFLKKRHMRYHKTYQCIACDLTFNHWSKYQKHLKIDHEPKNEYICDHCQKNFKKRSHIVRHMKLHSDVIKIFLCPYENCQREYSKKSNLKQHIKVKHEKIRFNCTLCNSKLTTKAKLDQHVRRHNAPQKPSRPKTKATGRKERSDKGTFRVSTASKLAGISKMILNLEIAASKLNCIDKLDIIEYNNKE